MSGLTRYYPIKSTDEITEFLHSYFPLVVFTLQKFELNLNTSIAGDHLGLQALSKDEFDQCHDFLTQYSTLIHDGIIHERRNRVYRFNNAIVTDKYTIPRIEIFEPKPNADITKLRPGIEHIAFTVKNYERFVDLCKDRGVPIDKMVDIAGSKFFKTRLLNGIEIEFRNDQLGEAD